MAKKSSIDFKQVLIEKGEKFGFYVAAGLLAIFLALGGYVASKAASPAGIARDMETKVGAVQQKTVNGPSDPPEIDPVVFGDAKLKHISFKEYVTENPWFNIAVDEHVKRHNPKVFSITEAQVQFLRGSIGVMDIIEGGDGKPLIGILQNRPATKNDPRLMKRVKGQVRRPPLAGGVPGAPPAAPPPPPSGGGGKFGGGGGLAGAGGGGPRGPGAGGPANVRSDEMEVDYVPADDKRLESAKLAENILPTRMVVITGSIPYKKQLEAYAAALRARTPQELTAADLPLYRGFVVQRQKKSANDGEVVEEWTDIDVKDIAPLMNKVLEFEPDYYKNDPSLEALFARLVPEQATRLVLPRPKLKRGEYEPINLKSIDQALKTLKESGGNTTPLKNRVQLKLDDNDPFNAGGLGTGPGGAPGGPGGGLNDALIGNQGPGGKPRPGDLTAGGSGSNQQVAEDVWIMRFIDVTIEPGYVYRYRVKLKVANPNYRHNVKDLAIPRFAEEEELLSDWFEIEKPVVVPRDEYLYAAAKDESKRRVTEKIDAANPDVVFLQMQRWADFVRPVGIPRPQPIGDWIVADIKAHRGQMIGETTKIKLPLWSLVAGAFQFRDPPTRGGQGIFAARMRAEPTWAVDFTPLPQLLLVDFEGGSGTYTVNRRQIIDQAGVDVLLMTDDGKLIVRRSQADLADPERKKREEDWKKWLDQVQNDTDRFRNQGALGNSPTGPGNSPPSDR